MLASECLGEGVRGVNAAVADLVHVLPSGAETLSLSMSIMAVGMLAIEQARSFTQDIIARQTLRQ